jgi:transcriptional regulator with XRE-family HTH domain
MKRKKDFRVNINLRRLRIENKMTVSKLASLTGYSKDAIIKIENFRRGNPSIYFLEKCGKIFKVSVDYFLK